MTTDRLQVPTVTQPAFENPPSRKISIVVDTPEGPHIYDNRGYDSPRKRSFCDHIEHGPVRKKSVLHMSGDVLNNISNNINHLHQTTDKNTNETRYKKHSTTESVHSNISKNTRFSDVPDDSDGSWWYNFCVRCRQKESHPSWQPPHWPKLCPYPFCPTYRQFSRIIALSLLGLFTWCVVYAIIGPMAGPGGQLFSLAFLTLAAFIGGWLMSLTTLPGLIGMLIVGLIFQNVGLVNLDGDFQKVSAVLRKIALTMILIRAGLDLDPPAFKRLKFTILKLGLIPWIAEAVIMAITSHFFLGLPWVWGFLLGSVIAAVSPAVVVASLFRLRSKGYGAAKGIPTLIIAVSGIDDAVSVAVFGIIQGIMFTHESLTYQIIQGPLSIFGGIGFGVLWGYLTKFIPEKHDPFVIPLRILMLLGGGLVAIFGSDLIGFEGAGPLACVAAAFVSLICWSQQGWEVEDNPASTAFEIFWMIFEPILFGITGAQIKISELDPHIVSIGVGCMVLGIFIRILVTVLVGVRSKLNLKEKIFVALSWMAKATVQAALGPVALSEVHSTTEKEYGNIVLMICVLSIMLTAPTAAIIISLSGPRLLTKTRVPAVPEGWRRSHRPSIRDISIIDESEETEGPASSSESIKQSS